MRFNAIYVIVFSMALFLLSSTNVFAAGPYIADVEIVSITQTSTSVEVVASNVLPTHFKNIKFYISDTNPKQNAQLALLLTAVTSGKTLRMTFMVNPNEIVSLQMNVN